VHDAPVLGAHRVEGQAAAIGDDLVGGLHGLLGKARLAPGAIVADVDVHHRVAPLRAATMRWTGGAGVQGLAAAADEEAVVLGGVDADVGLVAVGLHGESELHVHELQQGAHHLGRVRVAGRDRLQAQAHGLAAQAEEAAAALVEHVHAHLGAAQAQAGQALGQGLVLGLAFDIDALHCTHSSSRRADDAGFVLAFVDVVLLGDLEDVVHQPVEYEPRGHA